MSKQTLLTAGTIGALCLMAGFSLHARAAGQDGMVVVRDAQTGKMRAPTPDELKALRAQAPATPALTAAPRAASLAPRRDGAHGVRLGDKTMVYEVVTRGADGKLSSACIQGADNARDAMTRAGTADPAAPQAATHDDAKETPHETR